MKTSEEITKKAEAIWSVMTTSQKMGVKMGLFPSVLTDPKKLEAEGFSYAQSNAVMTALLGLSRK